MTTFGNFIYGGYGLNTGEVPGGGTNGAKRPVVGQSSEIRRDAGSRVAVAFADSSMCWDGHHWTAPPLGPWSTFRLMDRNPTLARARGYYYGKLVSSRWEYQKRNDSIPETWVDAARETFEPIRREVIGECLRGLTYGHRSFEKVWEVRDGGFTLGAMDAFEPDGLMVWKYKATGRFAGIGYGQAESRLDEHKSWVFTLDGWGGDLIGSSYHVAAYDSWCDWNSSRWNRIGVGRKLAGILPVLKYPPGDTVVNGLTTDNGDVARQILASLGLGRGVAMPSLAVDQQEAINNPELAKTSLWQLEFMDAGSYSSATAGIIGAQEYDDKQLCRAWRLSERTLVEATTAGSRADSETHSAGDTLQLEYIDDEIAGQFNEGVVDDWARLKFGARPGDVFIKPVPLSDPALQFKQEVAKLFLGSPTAGPQTQANVELRALLESVELPLVPEGSVPEVMPEPPDPNALDDAA